MKEFKTFEDSVVSMKVQLDNTNKSAIPYVTNALLGDSNNLAPINLREGASGGTLRNSGVATSDTKKGILEWSTAYAKRWWFEKANFTDPNVVNKWGEVAWERNFDKYKDMYTKTWNSKK